MKNLLARFVKDESGATAIEYALIAAGIGIAIITAVNALGTAISDKFNFIKGKLVSSLAVQASAGERLRGNPKPFVFCEPDAVPSRVVHQSRLACRTDLRPVPHGFE